MSIAAAHGVVTAVFALAAAALTTGAWADQPPAANTRVLFQPIPVSWDLASFGKQSPQLPWDAKRPDPKDVWAVSYLGALSTKNFTAPDGYAFAAPGLTGQTALGGYFFRFDLGRNYDDAASAATDVGQSPEAPNFRPLIRSKNKRPGFSVPYLGFSLTAPTDPSVTR